MRLHELPKNLPIINKKSKQKINKQKPCKKQTCQTFFNDGKEKLFYKMGNMLLSKRVEDGLKGQTPENVQYRMFPQHNYGASNKHFSILISIGLCIRY